MTVKTRRPWITMVLAVLVFLNPLGFDLLYQAFFSGEALSRNIAGPIVLTVLAILLLIGVLEWLLRSYILKRRERGATSA